PSGAIPPRPSAGPGRRPACGRAPGGATPPAPCCTVVPTRLPPWSPQGRRISKCWLRKDLRIHTLSFQPVWTPQLLATEGLEDASALLVTGTAAPPLRRGALPSYRQNPQLHFGGFAPSRRALASGAKG